MLLAGAALARRIEAAEAAIGRGCAEGQPGTAILETGGGIAVFQGAESPLTRVVGLGLNGPVREADLQALESFFRTRGASVTIDVCPLADAGLLEWLAAHSYRISEFNNVLVKPLTGVERLPAPRVRKAALDQSELWSHTVGYGFFEQPELTDEEMDVGRGIFSMPGALCYLTSTGAGEDAGGGAMAICGGLATLFADSTIPRFRRQGLHGELIAARVNDATAAGCDLAAVSTLPGSGSQRNYERMGFCVVYTKATLVG